MLDEEEVEVVEEETLESTNTNFAINALCQSHYAIHLATSFRVFIESKTPRWNL